MKSCPENIFGFSIDVARQIEKPEVIRESLAHLGEKGYNLCLLHFYDAFKYRRHPAIGRKHAYSPQVLQYFYLFSLTPRITLFAGPSS